MRNVRGDAKTKEYGNMRKDRYNGANESEGIEGGLVENGKENGMKRKGCVGGAVVSVKWGKLQNNETAG